MPGICSRGEYSFLAQRSDIQTGLRKLALAFSCALRIDALESYLIQSNFLYHREIFIQSGCFLGSRFNQAGAHICPVRRGTETGKKTFWGWLRIAALSRGITRERCQHQHGQDKNKYQVTQEFIHFPPFTF